MHIYVNFFTDLTWFIRVNPCNFISRIGRFRNDTKSKRKFLFYSCLYAFARSISSFQKQTFISLTSYFLIDIWRRHSFLSPHIFWWVVKYHPFKLENRTKGLRGAIGAERANKTDDRRTLDRKDGKSNLQKSFILSE